MKVFEERGILGKDPKTNEVWENKHMYDRSLPALNLILFRNINSNHYAKDHEKDLDFGIWNVRIGFERILVKGMIQSD